MSILHNDFLKELIPTSVNPYDLSRVDDSHYELSLGDEYYTTNTDTGVKLVIKEGDQICIKPGQFALLLTRETITIPTNIMAFISIKASIKFRGLVNVSGFHVDPGFHGKLKFAVYNAGSKEITLDWGQPLFPMWFCRLSGDVERYNGSHYNQTGISSEDVNRINGEIVSPNVLYKKFQELSDRISNINLLGAIGASILVTILAAVLTKCADTSSTNAQIQATERMVRVETNANTLSTSIQTISNSSNSQAITLVELQKRVLELESRAPSEAK